MTHNTSTKKTKYIYVLSQRYSGSTLLSFLLATHPEVSTIGERRKFYNKSIKTKEFLHHKARHCSCGALFEDCPYLNAIKDKVLAKTNPADLNTNTTEFNIFNNKYINRIAYELIKFSKINKLPFTPFQNKINSLLHFNEVLSQETLRLDGTSAFLDTSKIIDHAFYLSMIKNFDFKVIWLFRDPRAQINSAIKYNKWTIEYAAKHWIKEMEANELILTKMNIPFIKQKYEDLCANPEGELQNIFKFVGLDEQQFTLDFRAQTQHIIGNAKMRLGKDAKIQERIEWQTELTSDQIKKIETLTADFL